MKGKTIAIALAAIMTLGIAGAQAQQKANTAGEKRIVLGTNQMAGDNGKFGLTYTIGQSTPVNFTLTDVRWSVTRLNIGGTSYAPGKDEKLLVLTYTIHNPLPQITRYDGSTLKFTVVDQENENHEGINEVRRKDGDESLSIDLKPAQKLEVQTVLIVPAKGTVPKLIVQHHSGGAVLRYDLRDALKPLPAPFAGDGMDALSEIKADKDQYLPLMYFDAKFLSTEFIEKRFGPASIPEDKVFLFPKFMVKKQSASNHILRFVAQAVTEDGDRYVSTGAWKGSTEEHAASYSEPGQELAIRMMIIVPKKAKIKQIRFFEQQEKESRAYVFPVDVQFEAPKAEQKEPSAASQAVNLINADEFTTDFKTPKGETAFEISHVETTDGKVKRSQITAGGRTAILAEDLTSGATTLYLPDTKETYTAPKAEGKEPQTKLSYFEMVYANTVAPKKKKGLLGAIGGSLINGLVGGLGQQLASGAALSALGQATLPQIVNATVASQFQGYAVHEFASQLGRAVLTSAMPTGEGAPEQVHAQVTVDKNIYVETTFKGRKQVAPETFNFDQSAAKAVNPASLYEKFAEFLSKSVPK